MKKLHLIFICLFLSLSVYADIPVVDLAEDYPIEMEVESKSPSFFVERVSNYKMFRRKNNDVNLGLDGRLRRLEQQIEYLDQLELSNKVDKLQQMVQDLRGLLEVQGHELQDLRGKQSELYKDLDNRVSNFSYKNDGHEKSKVIDEDIQTNDSLEVAISDEEMKEYAHAFNFIKDKKYSQAMINLHEYLKKYPNGKYSVNAHYWLGELFIISGEEEQAQIEFSTVVNSYSDSDKAKDALLKLGILAYDQSNYMGAQQKWNELLKRYPDSSAARIAKVRLSDLSKSGFAAS